MIARASADRRRPEHGGARCYARVLAVADAVNADQPAPAQRPVQIAAERGLPALAHLALVHRRAAARPVAALRDRRQRVPRRGRARRGRRAADRRPVRVQLRRLRSSDAVPDRRHAAGRGRRRVRRRDDAAAARRQRAPAIWSAASPACRVLVVGDVMLDRFIVGRVTRISPEAPVPVVRFESEHVRLGGAANVAHNIAALGGRAVARRASSARTRAAARLREQLARRRHRRRRARRGSRPADDREGARRDRAQSAGRAHRLRARRRRRAATSSARSSTRSQRLGDGAKALLVSDYLKGAITRPVVEALLSRARRPAAGRIPLIVDPKIPHLDLLRRRDARHAEPPRGGGRDAPAHPHRRRGARRRRATSGRARSCEAVLITRGEQGMWLSEPDGEGVDSGGRARGRRTSPAPATPSSRRSRSRSPPARRSPKPRARQPRRRHRRRQVRPGDGHRRRNCWQSHLEVLASNFRTVCRRHHIKPPLSS